MTGNENTSPWASQPSLRLPLLVFSLFFPARDVKMSNQKNLLQPPQKKLFNKALTAIQNSVPDKALTAKKQWKQKSLGSSTLSGAAASFLFFPARGCEHVKSKIWSTWRYGSYSPPKKAGFCRPKNSPLARCGGSSLNAISSGGGNMWKNLEIRLLQPKWCEIQRRPMHWKCWNLEMQVIWNRSHPSQTLLKVISNNVHIVVWNSSSNRCGLKQLSKARGMMLSPNFSYAVGMLASMISFLSLRLNCSCSAWLSVVLQKQAGKPDGYGIQTGLFLLQFLLEFLGLRHFGGLSCRSWGQHGHVSETSLHCRPESCRIPS